MKAKIVHIKDELAIMLISIKHRASGKKSDMTTELRKMKITTPSYMFKLIAENKINNGIYFTINFERRIFHVLKYIKATVVNRCLKIFKKRR